MIERVETKTLEWWEFGYYLEQQGIIYTDLFTKVLLMYLFCFNRENETPNKEVSTKLLKEVQEVEQMKNDFLCTERRILGMLLFQCLHA